MAHPSIHLNFRRVNTAFWKGCCHGPSRKHPHFRQRICEINYHIRQPKLVDVVPGNISGHSGILFTVKKYTVVFQKYVEYLFMLPGTAFDNLRGRI